MLKTKFNINEFTIIFFFWEDWKEKECSKDLVQPPSLASAFLSVQPLFSSAPPFSSFLFVSVFFLFSGFVFNASFVSVQRLLLFLFFLPFFSFQFTCCPFFQPKNIFFQPKTILSSAQTCCSFKFSPSFLFFFSGQRLHLFFFFFSLRF